jgi:hypothetical protein
MALSNNWSGRRVAALGLLAGALALSACSGENLFSLTAGSSATGPTVGIVAPGEGFTIAVGDSVQVLADVTAPDAATGVVYRSQYADTGEAAYVPETEVLGSVPAANLNNHLQAAPGQVAGQVYIVVEVTDALGQTGIDSVKVTIIG